MEDDVAGMEESQPVTDAIVKATFRLLVPGNAAGSIIGQKGEFIRRIRDTCKTGAYLRVPEMPLSSERLVLITCELDDIPIIIRQLCRPIFKALKEDPAIPDDHSREILLLINSQQAGRIVGKGGEKLKTIRLETGCERFKIYKDRLPFSEERVCEIRGTEDAIALAVQQTMEILSQHPLDRDHSYYMPMSEPPDEQGEWGGYLRFSGRARNDHFMQPLFVSPSNNHSSSYQSRDRSDRSVRLSRSEEAYNRDRSRDRGHERERSPIRSGGSAMSTKDIYIDDCYTRHVIGSKGTQITKIRRQSGADVQVAKDETVQNNERKISICGRQRDIDIALKMINEAIADKIDRDKRNSIPGTGTISNAPGEQFDYVNELFDRISSVVPFNDINNHDPAQVEEEIVISNAETATVIGPKGVRIKDMRRYTRCDIDIEKDKEVKGESRKITFKGTRRQVHRAMYMIQNISKVMR